MPPADKKLGSRISIRPMTSLQKVMMSAEFDLFIIGVILINCVFMASESPVVEFPPQYITIANYFFNVRSFLSSQILESNSLLMSF